MRRFYAPVDKFHNGGITLGAEESHHIRKVLRLSFGDKIQVFDGNGNEFICEITGTVKRQTSLKITEQIHPAMPESELDLSLAVSILKGDKFDLIIQKSVELGVQSFVPIITKRCDVRLQNTNKKIERWKKIIIGATKQCGRSMLMKISEPIGFKDFLRIQNGQTFLFSERNGGTFSNIKGGNKMTAIIGSEGGWEDSEIEFAKQNGTQIITFGGRILRAETAAISIPAILQHRFGDLN